MRKLRVNQAGNVLTIVIAIIAVGLVSLFAWYISDQQSANNTSQNQQDNTEANQQRSISLDAAKLPSGWQTGVNEKDRVIIDNSAIDVDPVKNCYVEVIRIDDATVKSDQQQTLAENKAKERLRNAAEDKGYTSSVLPARQLTIATESSTKTIDAVGFKLVAPDGGEESINQYVAHLVSDGFYISFVQSCSGTDFSEADKALLAIDVKL